MDSMALNIDIKHRNSLVVDNNISQMDIVPDLKIKGTLRNPIINGRAKVESGHLVYRKKEFEIKKGVIDFLNPYKTEPEIDIRGESRIREWLVELDISGTPDELIFSFRSEPALEEGDIFSLVVLGKTPGEMIESEGGSTQSAAQMLSQLMASGFKEDIRRTTGLDILEAEVFDESDESESAGMKVTLGKELSRRLTLKYSSQDGKW